MLKQYLKFVIPSICSMVIFNLYTLVDGIFVAHYEGDTALASINVASPYVTTIFSIGVLFAIGSSTVMSIYRGANEERKMHEVFTMNTITISCGPIINPWVISFAVSFGFCLGGVLFQSHS